MRPISIAGRRGQLDELEKAVQRVIPNAKLRKSETDLVVDDEFLDTEKLIQVLFALMPPKLFDLLEKETTSKAFAYSQKMKLFQQIAEGHENDRNLDAIYRYFLDIAGHAWKLYEKWKSHPGFHGTRLRSIERENGEVANVPDGIVFPILSALSVFVTHSIRRVWSLAPSHYIAPSGFGRAYSCPPRTYQRAANGDHLGNVGSCSFPATHDPAHDPVHAERRAKAVQKRRVGW